MKPMRALPFLVCFVVVLTCGAHPAPAGEDAAAPGDPLAPGLELLRLRLEAQLGKAELLREMGQMEAALQAYQAVEEMYAQGHRQLQKLLQLDRVRRATPAPLEASPAAARLRIARHDGPAGGAFAGRSGAKTARPMRGGNAVDAALRWLAAHQSPGGGWESAGFGSWCDGKPASEGPDGLGKDLYDPGVTGLALCAFLGAGYTNRGKHPYAKVVAKGLRYLKTIQDAEGCFGPRTSQHFIYNHATASLAMVEAYGMTSSPIFKGSAQKALDFVAASRNPYFTWRYGVRPGDNDTSVTGWMMMVLKSAKLINEDAKARGRDEPLVIDEAAFDGVKAWLDKMTDPEFGRVGYIQRGGSPARPQALIDKFPADKSESMTAVGLLGRIFLGENPRTSEMIRKGARLLEAQPPTWNPSSGQIDMYYWYYGTLAMFQIGGSAWSSWSKALETAVIKNQRQDTTPCLYQGSWDPIGPWGMDGGRVYATALMAMCLEVHYRYDRVFGAK